MNGMLLQRWGANYWQDFNKQVIAWQRITSKNQFCLSTAENYYFRQYGIYI